MSGLAFAEFEAVYEALAQAIDSARPEREALFLTRFALLLAQRSGNVPLVHQCLADALDGLDQSGADTADDRSS